jgi:hypothetical protein
VAQYLRPALAFVTVVATAVRVYLVVSVHTEQSPLASTVLQKTVALAVQTPKLLIAKSALHPSTIPTPVSQELALVSVQALQDLAPPLVLAIKP